MSTSWMPDEPQFGMRRRVDDLLIEREVARAPVDEGDDGLVLLREQRDEVHVAIVVQIDRNDVDAAGARIDRVADERGLRVVRRLVLEDRDLSRWCDSRRPRRPDRACRRR